MANTKKTLNVVATICLYGNHKTGAGWLAQHKGGMIGTGEPRADRSFTEAVWAAAGGLQVAGVKTGTVAIFAPGGERVAYAPVGHPPAFGELVWETAPVHTISAEAVLEASR